MGTGRTILSALVLTTILGSLAMSSAVNAQQRFVQDRIAIGFWVDPPIDDKADARYAEIAEANFTMVIGGFGAGTPEKVRTQLQLCEKYNLKAVVAQAGLEPAKLPESPALWGYSLRDEPNVKDFPALRKQVDAIRAARPRRLAYINLFPNYASPEQLGAPTYDEHVARFVKEVDTDVLSMDHYPPLQPGADGRDNYCANLDVMRKYSLQSGIPFWNFFNSMPFGPHFDPTEAVLRWQIYTSLAYGAKGVLYFCYWTPGGDEFPKGGAIITAEGRRTRHYDQAKRINAAIKNLGPALMQLTSTAIVRVKPGEDAAKALAGSPVKSISAPAGNYLIGVFKHRDGRRAVLIANYDHLYTSWPTVEFDVDPGRVLEVSQETGKEAPVVDDSPAMPGLQLSLDSGAGRLFILPPQP